MDQLSLAIDLQVRLPDIDLNAEHRIALRPRPLQRGVTRGDASSQAQLHPVNSYRRAGSPIATASYDPATRGQVLQRSRYEPYGKVAQYDTQTFGFTGHVNAADVGLVYMQQRYYDPIAARFLSVDPVTTNANFGSSFNRYNYASNSLYKYIDPDGRATVTAEACLVACAGVTLGYSKGEIALTINAGLGLGGGLSIDPRSGENGRSNYVNPDAKGGKYGGVAVDAYNKVGVEIGVLEKGVAVGAKLSGGRDLTSGEHVGVRCTVNDGHFRLKQPSPVC